MIWIGFVLFITVCGDSRPPCRELEKGFYTNEEACYRAALQFPEAKKFRCAIKVKQITD